MEEETKSLKTNLNHKNCGARPPPGFQVVSTRMRDVSLCAASMFSDPPASCHRHAG